MGIARAGAALFGRLSRAGPGLWVCAALAGAVVQAAFWTVSEPAWLFSDFHKAYYPVGEMLLHEGRLPTWQEEESSAVGFVNIPILGYLFVPLALLEENLAAWVFLGLGAAAGLAAWALLVRFAGLDRVRAAALLFLFLANGPLVNSLREGNTTHFVLLLMIAALLLWRRRAEFAAGLALGVCAVIKLPLLLLGVYFVLRGRWRVVAGGAVAVGTAALATLAAFGREIALGWYQACIEPFMSGVIPAFNVQSIDGFLMRLATGAALLEQWDPVPPSDGHRLVRAIAVGALFAGVFWLLWRGRRRAPDAVPAAPGARGPLEFALVLNLALVTTPVAWTHYYLWLLLPFALYLGGRLPLPADAATRRLMWGGLALSALPVVMVPIAPGWLGEVAARSAVSAWLAGGLAMLAALARGAARAASARLVGAAASPAAAAR
jgi:alpha-1,2-mannosyltransferase